MVAFAAAAMLMLLAASSAGATYKAGTPLSLATGETGGASTIAINQTGAGGVEAGTVYVAEWGTPILGKKGKVWRFSPGGSTLSCTLTPETPFPGSVSVDPSNGNLFVANISGGIAANTRLRTFPATCGAETGTEFQVDATQERAIPQPATDASGNIYWPNPLGTTTGGKVEKITPSGTKTTVIEGLNRPTSTAFDSAGNLYVATNATSASNCTGGNLVKFNLGGSLPKTLAEGTVLLEGSVSTVAVDKSTNSIFVGRGCGVSFHVEKYNAAGTKLDDFGTGMFTITGSTSVFQQIAVNESNGKVYVGNPGSNKRVEVFEPEAVPKFTLTVNKTGTGSGAVTSSPAGINCGGDCSEEYEAGTEVTLTASEESGSEFTGWSGACSGSGECKVTMSEAKSVTANFDLEPVAGPELTVVKEGTGSGTVVSSPAGIECGGTCTAEFTENAKVTLTASPSAGSLFVSWKGCEKGGVNGRQCTVTMDAAKTVNAKFLTAYDVTVNRVGTGLGKVSSSPGGVLCLSNCASTTAAFKEGTSVTLSAAPTKNYVFTEWTGDCSGSSLTCSLGSLGADKTVGAKFTAIAQHSLTLTKSGGGQGTVKSNVAGINCGATCSSMAAAYYLGTEVELTPTPGKGSTFGGWSGACTGTGACKVTISAAKSVTAEFK